MTPDPASLPRSRRSVRPVFLVAFALCLGRVVGALLYVGTLIRLGTLLYIGALVRVGTLVYVRPLLGILVVFGFAAICLIVIDISNRAGGFCRADDLALELRSLAVYRTSIRSFGRLCRQQRW